MDAPFSGRSQRSARSNHTGRGMADKIEDNLQEPAPSNVGDIAIRYQIAKNRWFDIYSSNRSKIIVKKDYVEIIPPNMA